MATYWITFRLAENATYTRRYDELVNAVRLLSTKWWVDATSFIVFASNETIDSVAETVQNAINLKTDIAVVGMPDYKSARLIGETDDEDIFALIPFIKKV